MCIADCGTKVRFKIVRWSFLIKKTTNKMIKVSSILEKINLIIFLLKKCFLFFQLTELLNLDNLCFVVYIFVFFFLDCNSGAMPSGTLLCCYHWKFRRWFGGCWIGRSAIRIPSWFLSRYIYSFYFWYKFFI